MRKFDGTDNRNKYEFADFQNNLLSSFDKEKQNALIMTLFPLAKEGIKLKCDLLRARIWVVSTFSGVCGKDTICFSEIKFLFILNYYANKNIAILQQITQDLRDN